MANRFLNNIRINDEYTLPLADGSANQVITTDGVGNLSFTDVNSVIDTATEEVYYTCKNSTGATLAKGKGVMAVGTDGNSGHILMDEMVADGSIEPKYFLGILAESVGNGNTGKVIHFGEIDQFNTTGQNGETWANGQVLWCDPDSAGDFTITEPDGPNVKMAVAFILKASTNGKIRVRVQGNEGIHELHDTKITTQADGELLVWNNTLGVWQNDGTATIDYTNGRVGIGTTSPTHLLSLNRATEAAAYQLNINNVGGISDGNFTGIRFSQDSNASTELGSIKLYYHTDGTTDLSFGTRNNNDAIFIKNGGNVGIGTTNPTAPLDTNGVRIGRDFSIANRGTVRIDSNGTSSPSDVLFGHTAAANQTSWSGVYWSLSSRGTSDSGKFQLWRGSGHASPYNSELRVITVMPSGDTGIGESDPTQKLHVAGNIRVTGAYYDSNNSAGTSGQVLSSTATGTDWVSLSEISGVDGTGTANYIAKWSDADTITNSVIYDNGTNVSIGTTSATAPLVVQADSGGIATRLKGRSADGYAFLSFRNNADNATNGEIGISDSKNMLFYVNGAEKMRIDSSGRILINATSTIFNDKLYINNDAYTSGGWRVGTSSTYVGKLYNSSGILTLESDGSRDIQFGSSTYGTKMYIDTSASNVGIGNTTPQDKLDVTGVINSSNNIVSNATYTMFTGRSNRTVNDYGGLNKQYFKLNLVTPGPNTTGEASAHGFGDLRFQLANNAGSTAVADIMTLRSGGNVGIGTTTPQTELHVKGTNGWGEVRVEGQTFASGHGGSLEFYSEGTALADIYANTTKELILRTNGTSEAMRIDSDGNVVIGNTSAAAKLDIRQDTGYAFRTENASGWSFRVEADTGNIEAAGSVKMANDTDTASADKVGTLRYRADANNSYVDMCMQTGASTYEWINIVQNNW